MRSWLALNLVALLLVGTSQAATHVNISIGHQAATNPADVTYVDGQAPAELRAGPAAGQHHSDFSYPVDKQHEHFGRLRSSAENAGNYGDFQYSHESARLTAGGNDRIRQDNGQRQYQQQQQQQQRQLKKAQDKQNQEFERYIQSYHSGPTVETVFESSTPSSSSQRQTSSSSSSFSSSTSGGGSSKSDRLVAIGSRPAQVHSFERQVALPTAAPTNALLPPVEDRQVHIVGKSNGAAVDAHSVSSSSSGFDQNNFDQSGNGGYSKPNYGGYDDSDVQNQYPPNVDESSQGGFNGYNGNDQSNGFYGGSTPAPNYLPSYPRPVVTKTIQIAQPALKAKKYEIRHPAIQKEFYDIEERVLIKPAGTIVVELEHPVAKIPKGETVLPLGHPHPAVASAYNNNGAAVVQTMSSDVSNNNGNGNFQNNQYSPSPVYNPKTSAVNEPQHPQTPVISSTTIASTLTTTPSYNDDDSKDEFVESNLNKQFKGDAQFITTTERSYSDDSQQNGDSGFYATTTESNRNYNTQFYGRDEPDRRYNGNVGHVDIKNNGAPGVSTAFMSNSRPQAGFAVSGQSSYGSGRAQYQPSSNNFNDNSQYKGEFLSNEFYNRPQSSKPARLQEQPRQFSSAAANGAPRSHIVKHEHNIHLPASQHNIYLGRYENEPVQQTERLTNGDRYNEEAARVLELKPYLKHHPGSVVVYAANNKRPAFNVDNNNNNNGHYYQQRNYDHARYAQNPGHSYQPLQYSAPYSQMRYHPDQSARYVYGSEAGYGRSGNYVTENNNFNQNNGGSNGYQSMSSSKSETSSAHPHAHIQIQIPHHPHEADKAIVVSSTISPVVHNAKEQRTARYRQPGAAASAVYYDDGASKGFERAQPAFNYERSARLESYKPDCDEANDAGYKQQKSLRIVEAPNSGADVENSGAAGVAPSIPAGSLDVSLKSAAGHIAASPGSRVIAATPAPTDAAASSESFHKRRIVVNHPFQTVREVVEHEPITNYHHVQVNEPASPQFYHHTAPYYQQETHGAIRQYNSVPVLYHHHSATTHGNLHYAPVLPVVHGVYHHG